MSTNTLLARNFARLIGWLSVSFCLGELSVDANVTQEPTATPATTTESGTASYYADKYNGKPTASGEIFDMHQLTAAHPYLKFGTIVKVTNVENHRAVLVRINDRGPFVGHRVIDLSLAAAQELHMVKNGLAPVTLEVLPKEISSAPVEKTRSGS
jgi:rare lipoprotein A